MHCIHLYTPKTDFQPWSPSEVCIAVSTVTVSVVNVFVVTGLKEQTSLAQSGVRLYGLRTKILLALPEDTAEEVV